MRALDGQCKQAHHDIPSTEAHTYYSCRESIFNGGLDKELDQIKSFSMHYYQTFVGQRLNGTLLNHKNAISRTDGLFKNNIADLESKHPAIDFVLGEVGSALANHREASPTPGSLDRVLGSALWVADWALYATTAVQHLQTPPLWLLWLTTTV